MECNSNNVTNPLSTNQIVEVGIVKPRCFPSGCGNTLNDWLKWLSGKQCEIDWATFDLSCIKPFIDSCNNCEQTEKVVITTLIEGLCVALSNTSNSCCEETTVDLVASAGWTAIKTPRARKSGNRVTLTGSFQATSYTGTITNLPSGFLPTTELIVPIAHEFAPSAAVNIFLKIRNTGEILLYFNGTTPTSGSTRTIYLDGVTFFLN